MRKRLGSGALLLGLLALTALPAATQDRPERPERDRARCVCVVQHGDTARTSDRCSCAAWPDTITDEHIREAMARMEETLQGVRMHLEANRQHVHEAMARTREALEHVHVEFDPEGVRHVIVRSGEALERAREEIERLRLDTVRVFRALRPTPRLGIQFSPDAVEDRPGGVRILGVSPGSAAEEAGLRSGDVVVEVDGHDLSRPLPDEELDEREGSSASSRLRALTRDLEEGDTVRVVYIRDGERRTAGLEARRLDPWGAVALRAFEPGEWDERVLRLRGGDTIRVWPPGIVRAPRAPMMGTLTPGTGRFGLRLMDLNPELGAYFGRDEGTLVLEVRDDPPLDVRAGDVILRIDSREVEDARHAASILASYRSGERVRVEVLRRGRTEQVEGRVP